MNYQRVYNELINRAKDRLLEGYVENHHIVPRCMNGSDSSENLVVLTPEEHYLAHQLLVKIHKESKFHRQLSFAAQMMCTGHNKGRTTNKLYGWLRRQCQSAPMNIEHRRKISEALKGRVPPRKTIEAGIKARSGMKMSVDTRKKMSSAHLGKKRTEETKEKISKALLGRKKSKEQIEKMRLTKKGIAVIPNHTEETKEKIRQSVLARPDIVCPHCGKKGKPHTMKRWHFENCKWG